MSLREVRQYACGLAIVLLGTYSQPILACGLGPDNACISNIIVYGTRPSFTPSPYISNPASWGPGIGAGRPTPNLYILPVIDFDALAESLQRSTEERREEERRQCVARINGVRQSCIDLVSGSGAGNLMCGIGEGLGLSAMARFGARYIGRETGAMDVSSGAALMFLSCGELSTRTVTSRQVV